MASITASGLGSGIDINGLVSQLVAAERQPATQRLNRREAALQTQISAIGNFKSALAKFQSALASLKNPDTFQGSARATVGNDKLFAASADRDALTGTYSIKVEQLAQSHKLATSAEHRFQTLTDEVGTGTLTFEFGSYGQDGDGNPTFTANPDQSIKTVTIDATNNTLSGVMKAINDAKIGVQASIVNDGGGYRLVLGSTATGAANSLKITVDDGDGNPTDLAGLSLLAYDATLTTAGSGKNMIQTMYGLDARAVIDGLPVTSASNTLKEVVPGVTLDLKSTDSAPTTLTITQDNSAINNGIQSFVKAFNELASTVKSLTAYNPETKQAGALQGDFSVRSIFGQLRGVLNKVMPGASPQLSSLADLGITTERDGTLKLDTGKLQKAIEADPQGVASLFVRTQVSADSPVKPDGVAQRLDDLLSDVLGGDGPLNGRTESLNKQVRRLDAERERLDTRMASLEERYRAQFMAMDKLVSQLTATGNFLTQQLSIFSNNNNTKK